MITHTPCRILKIRECDHVRGPAVSPVTLLEYGDYECPYCEAAHSVVEDVRRRMGRRIRFVYRHFPLMGVHPHAQPAAEAAEAAGAQGRFWEMHDRLFRHPDALDDGDLVAHAVALSLDRDRFVRDLAAGVHVPRVREDFMTGVRSGVNGTPTLYINGVRHDGGLTATLLIDAIEFAYEAAVATARAIA